jgi:ribokinase
MSPRVVVVGSVNMDLVAQVPRWGRLGETLSGTSLASVPGGKGANQAVAAARLGATVTFCGRVGDDPFGATLRAALCQAGVDDTAVRITPATSSGVAWIAVDPVGRNGITVIPGANGTVTPADVGAWSPLITAADVVLVQGEIPLDAIAAVLQVAQTAGVRTVFDVAPVPPEPWPAACWQADVLSPNQAEAEQLTGVVVHDRASAQTAATQLLSRGARAVLLKLGELGALWQTADEAPLLVPAFPVQPVDTTAAGDAFTAGFATAWSAGQSIAEAVRWACAVGACATLQPGAQPAMPTAAQVEAFLAKQPSL